MTYTANNPYRGNVTQEADRLVINERGFLEWYKDGRMFDLMIEWKWYENAGTGERTKNPRT